HLLDVFQRRGLSAARLLHQRKAEVADGRGCRACRLSSRIVGLTAGAVEAKCPPLLCGGASGDPSRVVRPSLEPFRDRPSSSSFLRSRRSQDPAVPRRKCAPFGALRGLLSVAGANSRLPDRGRDAPGRADSPGPSLSSAAQEDPCRSTPTVV